MDEQEQALAELEALVKVPGALRIITNAERPAGERDGLTIFDPAYFVIHDVTSLEVVEHRGTVLAHSDEGDWTEGRPVALLKRLREWRG